MRIPRRLLSLLLIGCMVCVSCCISGIPSQAGTVQLGEVTGTGVFIREDANTTSAKRAQVSNVTVTINGTKKGEKVGSTDIWYNVTYNGITGYIYGDFIKLKTVTTDQSFEAKLKQFPESYKTALRNLHATYPNWKFVADSYSLTLDEAVNLEIERKLVQGTGTISHLSMGFGAYDWDTGKYVSTLDAGWYVASREVIRYYMDPRNFLTASDIFMYMHLGYDASTQTKAGVETIIKGTFMEKGHKNNKYGDYAALLMEAAQESKVSPYFLAAKIIQEQGVDGSSSMISGTYSGFAGYYNFFNVKASGSTRELIYKNGLTYAKNNGWNSIEASIKGGAAFCAEGYISAGQDTYFKMDYNIKDLNRLWHQYAGAVHDALSCGQKLAKSYTGISSSDITFYIPVYNNMPSAVSALPAKSSKCNNYYFNSIASSGLTPSFNRFTYSYSLYLTGDQTVTVTVPSGASYASNASYPLNTGQNTVVLKVKSQSGYTNDYTLHVTASKACTLYVNYGQGTTQTGTTSSPTPVKKILPGDVNGDSTISLIDLVSIQRHLLKKITLKDDAFTAADTNSDGKISLIDLVNVRRHLLGKIKLS